MLLKIGSVCRLSTTPATKLRGLIKASRDMLNFMVKLLRDKSA
jgi:hypothetical protein